MQSKIRLFSFLIFLCVFVAFYGIWAVFNPPADWNDADSAQSIAMGITGACILFAQRRGMKRSLAATRESAADTGRKEK